MTAEREALEWIANVRVEEQPHVFATGLEAFCGDHMHLRLARTMARAALLGLGDSLSGNAVDAVWEESGGGEAMSDCDERTCPLCGVIHGDGWNHECLAAAVGRETGNRIQRAVLAERTRLARIIREEVEREKERATWGDRYEPDPFALLMACAERFESEEP